MTVVLVSSRMPLMELATKALTYAGRHGARWFYPIRMRRAFRRDLAEAARTQRTMSAAATTASNAV
jgi:hypothetical protein